MRSSSFNLLALTLLVLFIALITTVASIDDGSEPRKLDENVPGSTEKCTPCTEEAAPPPPPPPIPCPPPPSLPPPPPPPSPPPPPKKTPSQNNCPPPPSSYIYIQGPPGSLYPIDQDFGGATPRSSLSGLFLVGFVLLGLLALW